MIWTPDKSPLQYRIRFLITRIRNTIFGRRPENRLEEVALGVLVSELVNNIELHLSQPTPRELELEDRCRRLLANARHYRRCLRSAQARAGLKHKGPRIWLRENALDRELEHRDVFKGPDLGTEVWP